MVQPLQSVELAGGKVAPCPHVSPSLTTALSIRFHDSEGKKGYLEKLQ
jgi:hypothetical protein